MKTTLITSTLTLALVASTAAVAAPQTEVSILGGQAIFNKSDFQAEGVDGTFLGDSIDDALDIDHNDLRSHFSPGIRLGVRLGDSPAILTAGVRNSDYLELSYGAGLRLNTVGSNLGMEFRAVRYDDDSIRTALGDDDIEGEVAITYDVAKYLRLGAGLTTVALDDNELNGLVTADLVFKFGGESAVIVPALVPVPVVVTPEPTPVETPIEEVTGERG